MKKSILFFLLMLGSVSFIYGQTKTIEFHPGLKFGISGSFFYNRIGAYGADPTEDYKGYIRPAVCIGGVGQFRIKEAFSFQIEVLFSPKGGAYRLENKDVYTSSNQGVSNDGPAYYYKYYRLNYLEVPVLINLNISRILQLEHWDGNNSCIFLSSGIAPAINVGSSLRYNGFHKTYSGGSPWQKVEESFNVEKIDHAKKYNMSIVLDLSANEEKSFGILSVNLRYTHTLGNVYNIKQLDGYNMKTAMGTLVFGFGFKF